MSRGADQVVPSKVTTFPPLSTATQKPGAAHDSEARALLPTAAPAGAGSTGCGTDQDVPFQAKTFPTLSPATQNEVPGHERASSCPEVSTSCGCVHTRPFHC